MILKKNMHIGNILWICILILAAFGTNNVKDQNEMEMEVQEVAKKIKYQELLNLIYKAYDPTDYAYIENLNEKNDIEFKNMYLQNHEQNFQLPKIPIFQLIPEFEGNRVPKDMYIDFKVKRLHIVNVLPNGQHKKREYEARNYNYGNSKDYHTLPVFLFPDYETNGFYKTQITKISTGFWDRHRGSPNVGMTKLEMIFDQILNRVIFQQPGSKDVIYSDGEYAEVTYIIFDLIESPDKIQLRVERLNEQEKLTFRVNSLTEDLNRSDFNLPGLFFPQLDIPGELAKQMDRKLSLTENFEPKELTKHEIFSLTPKNFPTPKNPFELTLKLYLDSEKGLSDTIIVNVDAHQNWSLENKDIREPVKKIIFDLKNHWIWFVVDEDNIYPQKLSKTKNPTLELKNLKPNGKDDKNCAQLFLSEKPLKGRGEIWRWLELKYE